MWNQWRKDYPHIKPNLSEAPLDKGILIGAILINTNLKRAQLRGTHLRRAYLSRALLNYADLSEAILSLAQLNRAQLNGANLHRASLDGALLKLAVLSGADLSLANLSAANLGGAELNGANLCGADLTGADLTGADLTGADLSEANLRSARLTKANLRRANLTGAWLWETQRNGWSIQDVICDRAYWDEGRDEPVAYQRGDFERLFAKTTRISLFYGNRPDQAAITSLPALIQRVEELIETRPTCRLNWESYRRVSGGVVVKLEIEDPPEPGRNPPGPSLPLQDEPETQLELEGEIKQPKSRSSRPTTAYQEKTMDTAGTIYGPATRFKEPGRRTRTIFQLERSMDLPELARQLGELRQTIKERRAPSEQAIITLGEITKAEIAARAESWPQVIEVLGASGRPILDLARALGQDLVVEAIKQSLREL
ncbi:MAG TPA: pentapeptide repeat-containing protein [Blastocatellia bacterium]|nr:pentapeptide repeat-containing protein [Blastocatellia bacterium]